MTLGLSHYQLLSDILERIHYIYDEEELSRVVLKELSNALNTEAGTIFRVSESQDLIPTASYGASLDLLKALGFSSGKGVAGWVAQYGQPVKVDNPQTDPRFMGAADAATGFKTRSILSAPVMAKGKVVGVLEFINKKEGGFTIPDLELLSMIGRELGIAFENVLLIRKLMESHSYLKSIVCGLSAGLLVLDHEQRVVVINPRACEILCVDPKLDLENRPAVAKVAENAPEFSKLMISLARNGKPVQRGEFKTAFVPGEVTLGYSATPVTDKAGLPAGMTFLFQDITAYARNSGAEGGKNNE